MKTKRSKQKNIHQAIATLADPKLQETNSRTRPHSLGKPAAHQQERPDQSLESHRDPAQSATPIDEAAPATADAKQPGPLQEENADAAGSLGGPVRAATPNDEGDPTTADATPDQKLHRAIFDGDPEPDSPQDESPTRDSDEGKISDLLDQLGQGLFADDTTNFEKLTIARRSGAILLELKELVPHGKFQETLRERFPKINYSKCNRWMWLAEREAQVAETIKKYPDVAWGPKKMIDFLLETWELEEPIDDDEDDASGDVSGPLTAEESNIIVVKPEEEAEPRAPHAVPHGTTAGPVVEPVATTTAKQPSEPGRTNKRRASRPANPAADNNATTFFGRLSEVRQALDELFEMQLPIGDDIGRCLSEIEAIGARVIALLTKLHEANTADRADLTV